MAGKGKGLAIGKKTDIVEKPVTGNDDDNTIDQSAAVAANRINGGDGDDNIVGTGFADRVNAGDGDDTVMGGAGDDVLFGNDGTDTAAYEGSIFNFMWEEGKGNSLTVTDTTGAEGTDTLKHFELLQFDDYTFDLTGPNAALILADDQGTDEDNATTFGIEAWDFDGGSPFISSISVTGGGAVSASNTGSLFQGMGTGTSFDISYDPNGAYETLAVNTSTTETITVVIDDGQGNLSSKDIIVTIDGVNDAPTLGAGVMGAIEDGAVEVLDLSVLGDDIDSDDDGDSLNYTITGAPLEGSASIIGTDLAFDPGSDFQNLAVGETRDVVIEVTATDKHGATAVNEVTVTVTGTNDAPTLSAAATSATEDGASVDVDLAALGADVDSDDDGSTLTYSVSGGPAEGSASVNGTTLTFDQGADFQDLAAGETRDVTVQVTAEDSHGATATNDVTVTVTGTNDAPVIGAADTSGAVQAEAIVPGANPGTGEMTFHVEQYQGYSTNNLGVMQNIMADPAAYNVTLYEAEADFIDFVDYPVTGYSATNQPWPAAVATGQTHYTGVNDYFFARITTEFEVDSADTFTFRSYNDDGVYLFIDGVQIINDPTYHGAYPLYGNIALQPGSHTLELFFFEHGGAAVLELSVANSSGNFQLMGQGAAGLSGVGGEIVLTDSGSIDFTDVDLSDTHTVSVTPNGSGYLGDMTASLADASTGDGAGSVDWDFSVSNDDLAYLAAGESLTQSYTVTVTDNNGASDTEIVTVTLNGTNDDPTASAIVAPGTNEDAGPAAIDLLATANDVDLSDDLDVANVAVSSSDGRTVAYSVDNETGAFSIDPGQYNDLAVGESATVTVEYDVVDGNGGSVANTASITVEGRNDAPSVASAIVVGGGGNNVVVVGTNSSDVASTVAQLADDTYFDFDVTGYNIGAFGSEAAWAAAIADADVVVWGGSGYGSDGASGSTLWSALADFNESGGGIVTTGWGHYTVGNMSQADQALVNGLMPFDFNGYSWGNGITSVDSSHAATDGISPFSVYSWWETTSSIDSGAQSLGTASNGEHGIVVMEASGSAGAQAYLGGLYLAASGYSQAGLRSGETDRLLEQTVKWATGGTGGVSEDGADFSIDLLQGATDPDTNDVLNVANLSVTSGNGSGVGQNGNSLDVSPNAYNYLAEGESETIVVSYDIIDGNGGSVAQTATITIAGENDAPTATGDTGSVTEDGTLVASGNLGATDPDANDTLSYALNGSATGTYGSISVDANGNWVYTLNNDDPDLDNLDAGQSAVDSFVFNISDGNGGSTTANVDVTVNGADEAPDGIANGTTLFYQYSYPYFGQNYAGSGTNFVVTDGVELSGLWGGWSYASIDVSEDGVYVDFYGSAQWSYGSFNGWRIVDNNDLLPDIIGLTLETNMPGLDPSDIGFNEDSIWVNWQGLPFNSSYYVDIGIEFA